MVSVSSRQHRGTYVDPAGNRWAAVWSSGVKNAVMTPLYLRPIEEGPGPATHTVTLVCSAKEVRLYLRLGSRIPMPCQADQVVVL